MRGSDVVGTGAVMVAEGDAVEPMGRWERLLTPAEVAAMFRVDPKTVTRWASPKTPDSRRLACIRTLGGHRRFRERDVRALLERSDEWRSPRAAE